MKIWRINIKPDSEENIDPRIFCITKNILGVGWPVDWDGPLDKETNYKLGEKKYYKSGDKGWWPAINAIQYRMEINDLCWTRDWDGNYYIGKILGEWEYLSTKDYIDADIVNVRPCNWVRTGGVDSVPGKVLNSFRAPRTVQAVDDNTVEFYSKLIYSKLNGENAHCWPSDRKLNLFSLISPEDCEDIVGIYIQEKFGFRLIPSSCRHDTVKTEFVLKNVEGERAYVQVKQGVALNVNDFKCGPRDSCEWFLFSTHGQYFGSNQNYVHCLKPIDIQEFVFANRNLMSGRVQTFIEFLNSDELPD